MLLGSGFLLAKQADLRDELQDGFYELQVVLCLPFVQGLGVSLPHTVVHLD